jgi:hypothetical protein
MSKLKSRADEILDGLNDPDTLEAVRRVQAKIGVTYSDERIDRLTEKVSFLESVTQAQSARIVVLEKTAAPVKFENIHDRLGFLENVSQGYAARIVSLEKPRPDEVNVTADTESLTAYIHRLETLINDIEKELKASINATDRARVRGDDAMHDLVTRTANSLYAEINAISAPLTPPFDPARISELEARIRNIEDSVDNYNGPTGTQSKPQRDTSWHPHEAKENYWSPVLPDERVVVMIRGSDQIQHPTRAGEWNWGENGYSTIIAWRYAKEGE